MDTQKLYSWTRQQQNMDIGVIVDEMEKKQAQDMLDKQQMNAPEMEFLDKTLQKSDEPVAPVIMDRRANVPAHMPPTIDIFSQKQSLVRMANYTFYSKDGTAHKGSRNKPSKKYMKPILDNLKHIDELLNMQYDPKNIDKDKDEIEKMFRKTILACEDYVANRNPWTSEGKARLQMVKDFQAQLQHESIMFTNTVQQLEKKALEENNAENEIGENEIKQNSEKHGSKEQKQTWLSILAKVRTEEIKDGENGCKVTIGGAGTSKIYIVEKDGKKRYFKENEKIPNGNYYTNLDLSVNELNKVGDDTSKRRADYLTVIKQAIKSHYATDEDFRIDVAKNKPQGMGGLVAFIRAKLAGDKKLTEIFRVIDIEFTKHQKYEESDMYFIDNELREALKRSTCCGIATKHALIDPKSEISKRNVATSRMAELLGIGDMVAKSVMADVIINGKKMSGIAMEEAKGQSTGLAHDKAAKKQKRTNYSPNAFRQLLNLQIFDIICGQVDRNGANYLAEEEEIEKTDIIEFTKIKAIDNDMAFGNLKYNDLLDRGDDGLNRMRNIESMGELHVPAMDKKFADSILALDAEKINYALCDVLSIEEREALIDRVKGVQKAIRRRQDYEKKLRRKDPKAVSMFVEDVEGQENWKKAYERFAKKVVDMKEQDKKNVENIQAQIREIEENTGYKDDFKRSKIKNLTKHLKNAQERTHNFLFQKTYFLSYNVLDK